jgi:predicted RecA/RadA family phage recombinase
MKHLFKNLSYTGLAFIAAVFAFTIACLFAESPKDGSLSLGMSGLGLMFFGVTGIAQDSVSNLRTLKYTHSSALAPGDPLVVNGSLLIALNTTLANVENVFIYQGKVNLPKTNPLVISALDAVYWDAAASEINKTSGGNTACGFCAEAALSADTTVTFMLIPNVAILDLAFSSQNVITDPGQAGAIPVTASGVCEIVTTGAQTRTLAAPSFLGEILELSFKTDGGDCVITCATTVNQTGNNTITLNDAGDCVTLIAKSNGANKRWSVLANDGASLTTV